MRDIVYAEIQHCLDSICLVPNTLVRCTDASQVRQSRTLQSSKSEIVQVSCRWNGSIRVWMEDFLCGVLPESQTA